MLGNIVNIYLFFAVILTSYYATYLLSKSKACYMKFFSVLSFFASLYMLGYLLEINSATLEQKIFYNQVQHLFLPFLSILWLTVALHYTKGVHFIPIWKMALLFIAPSLTFFIRLTNSFHHLFYMSFELRHAMQITLLYTVKGPWYYIQITYMLLSLTAATIVFYNQRKKNAYSDHTHFRVIFIASLIPYMGLFLTMINYMNTGINYMALLLPISLSLIMLTIHRYDYLEITTLAREAVFDNSCDSMVLLDKQYRILGYNRAARDLFRSLNIFINKSGIKDSSYNQIGLIDIIKNKDLHDFKLYQDGQEKFFNIISSVMLDSHGREVGVLKTIRDITVNKKMQNKLEILATIDEMSGLYNRRQFMELAKKEFARAVRYNHIFSVLIIDIDHFKAINDTKGHAAGDDVIREFGRLMNNNFRQTDICGRIGGEEFAVILTNTSIDSGFIAAEKFRQLVLNTKIFYEGTTINISISIGVSTFIDETSNIDEILKDADKALYKSKTRGRNRVSYWVSSRVNADEYTPI